MESTNREIIDNFVPKFPNDYTPQRFDIAALEDQVPGYTGLLSRTGSKKQQTNYNIPLWIGASTDSLQPDIVTLEIAPYLDLSGLDSTAEDAYFASNSSRFQRSLSNQPDPVPLPIPQSYRAPGLYLIRYRVFVADSGVDNYSVAQLLVVDETTPYDGPRVKPPAPQLPAGMTGPLDRAFIASQPNQTVNLPIPYSALDGLSPDDTVEMFFGSSDRPYVFTPAPGTDTKYRLDPALPPSIPLPLWVVEAEKKGNYTVRYVISDVAGNPSEISYSLDLEDLAEAPAPSDFLTPQVELAAPGDGLINIKDVADANGVRVMIPSYLNVVRPTDQLVVTLSSSFGSIPITVPVGNTPFAIPVTFTPANMDTLYGPRAAGKSRVPVTASYQVRRGTSIYPAAPLSTPFDLDLSVVGPDPTPPGDVNTNLPPVVVQAIRAGGTFGPPNHLEAADVNLPARALVPLWTAAVLPQDSLPFTVTLNYGGRLYPQTVTAIPPSGAIEFQIPFADIRTLGGPTQPASYTLTSLASANPQTSPPTLVRVDSVILQMSAPRVLNNTGTLNCDSLRPINSGNLVVHIPGSEYLTAGQFVSVTFAGYQNNTGSGAAVVTEVRTFSVPDDVAARNGFDVTFPANSTLLFNPINANRSLLTTGSATVTTSTLYLGSTVSSLPATYRVRGFRPATSSANYCAGGAVPT
ncbi:hypothetical protein ACXX81_11665 [Pseudomonas sp. GNP013]